MVGLLSERIGGGGGRHGAAMRVRGGVRMGHRRGHAGGIAARMLERTGRLDHGVELFQLVGIAGVQRGEVDERRAAGRRFRLRLGTGGARLAVDRSGCGWWRCRFKAGGLGGWWFRRCWCLGDRLSGLSGCCGCCRSGFLVRLCNSNNKNWVL